MYSLHTYIKYTCFWQKAYMFLGFLRQVSDMLCYLNNNSTAIPILKIKETLHPAPLLPSNPMGMGD